MEADGRDAGGERRVDRLPGRQPRQVRKAVACGDERVLRPFELAGVARNLTICDSREKALGCLACASAAAELLVCVPGSLDGGDQAPAGGCLGALDREGEPVRAEHDSTLTIGTLELRNGKPGDVKAPAFAAAIEDLEDATVERDDRARP